MKKFLTLVLLLFLTIGIFPFQRMGAKSGTYIIGIYNTTTIPAVCLDFSRPAPRNTQSFNYASGNASIYHHGYKKHYSIQTAINRNFITITGVDKKPTVDQLLTSMRKTKDSMTSDQLKAYEYLEKNKHNKTITDSFLKMIPPTGSFDKLQIKNMTNFKLTVNLKEPMVFMIENEEVSDLKESLKILAKSKHDLKKTQSFIWINNTLKRQKQLKKLGYTIQATGKHDDQTKLAIKQFQKNNNLKVTGKFDAATISKLF